MTKKIVTHSGGYHADDVFACATLALYFEKENEPYRIIRSRDAAVIADADILVDIGQKYDPDTSRFDHHQTEGAGTRENGIPYAAFGLVWKHYGTRVTEDTAITERIDQKLVQAIDAPDNGVDITKNLVKDVSPYYLHNVLQTFAPTWEEDGDMDKAFQEALSFAKEILNREIAIVRANIKAELIVDDYYQKSNRKQIVLIDEHVFERGFLVANMVDHNEVQLIVFKHRSGNWHVAVCRDSLASFTPRINLPKEWGGLPQEELRAVTKVPDATFCHPKLFLCGATSKEGALALAEQALFLTKN